MHPLTADGTGDHLHRPVGIVAPRTDIDLGEARIPGRKKRRMPTEQAGRFRRTRKLFTAQIAENRHVIRRW